VDEEVTSDFFPAVCCDPSFSPSDIFFPSEVIWEQVLARAPRRTFDKQYFLKPNPQMLCCPFIVRPAL